MQTYKKRFRKKRTMKKQNQNKQGRILKGLVCYKIKIIPRSKRIMGGDGKADERLDKMIKEITITDDIKPFLQSIEVKDDDISQKKKREKVFNEILNEDTTVPATSARDTEEETKKKARAREQANDVKCLLYYLNTGRPSDELRKKMKKEELEKQLKLKPSDTTLQPQIDTLSKELTTISKEIQTSPYTEELYTEADLETLLNILLRKSTADEALKTILDSLDTDAVKKQLTAGQIESIKRQIEGTGSITSALASVKSSFSNSAVALGNWLVPESLDDDGAPVTLENKQKISFLWYPRKHIDYEKGSSRSKREKNAPMEYGDFMIMIEPEQFASIGEFFKQKYHSVEDLLATLLLGCTDTFCLNGEVKRKPYNWREYDINNKQPMMDKERKNKTALLES